jgi:hypothetical protein
MLLLTQGEQGISYRWQKTRKKGRILEARDAGILSKIFCHPIALSNEGL